MHATDPNNDVLLAFGQNGRVLHPDHGYVSEICMQIACCISHPPAVASQIHYSGNFQQTYERANFLSQFSAVGICWRTPGQMGAQGKPSNDPRDTLTLTPQYRCGSPKSQTCRTTVKNILSQAWVGTELASQISGTIESSHRSLPPTTTLSRRCYTTMRTPHAWIR